MPSKNVQDGGILLADDWKLYPLDERNWELCHLCPTKETPATKANGTAGVVRWQRCGRFYSYNTIDEAMLYVIDALMKDGCKDDALALASAMRQWQQLAESVRETARSPK
jgi:hypothetical protein